MWIIIKKFSPPIKIVVAKNDKEWITPKIKCLIAQRRKAHHSGRQVVSNQLAKKDKNGKKMLNTNLMN